MKITPSSAFPVSTVTVMISAVNHTAAISACPSAPPSARPSMDSWTATTTPTSRSLAGCFDGQLQSLTSCGGNISPTASVKTSDVGNAMRNPFLQLRDMFFNINKPPHGNRSTTVPCLNMTDQTMEICTPWKRKHVSKSAANKLNNPLSNLKSYFVPAFDHEDDALLTSSGYVVDYLSFLILFLLWILTGLGVMSTWDRLMDDSARMSVAGLMAGWFAVLFIALKFHWASRLMGSVF